jgi:solute carrier family 35 protein E3
MERPAAQLLWLVLNLVTAIGIIFVNKILMNDIGLKVPIALTLANYCTTCAFLFVAASTGIFERRSFPSDRWGLRIMLTLAIASAPVVSNVSLFLNSVGTYQLFKTLQVRFQKTS